LTNLAVRVTERFKKVKAHYTRKNYWSSGRDITQFKYECFGCGYAFARKWPIACRANIYFFAQDFIRRRT